jgi:predicted NUDIX family phosphoesterase
MVTFLDAAYEVLLGEKRALSSHDIARRAIALGILHTAGRTPGHTMRARLATDILTKKNRSRFMRTDAGLFALRQWGSPEFVAHRHVRALLDEEVVVFPAAKLRDFVAGPGLWHSRVAYQSLLKECRGMPRRIAESDPSVIQLVSAFLVRHESLYLTHKRSKRHPESRLHGFSSVTFGGHLNPADVGDFSPLFDPFDPAQTLWLMERELNEELRIAEKAPMTFHALIYDDSREVSRQHLGIVYDVRLTSDRFQIGERGFLVDAKFESLPQMLARLDDFENWSQMLIRHEAHRGW